MKTLIKKLQQNNKGMSLIEILVTLAIISIIASPLIRSFLTAMDTNAKARIIQNGTSVAQDVAEQFKVFQVEDMYAKYTNADDENNAGITVTNEDGVYKFENIAMEGANGEDFLVDVTLNPAIYSGGVGSSKNKVNNVELPAFSGLHGSESIVIQSEYTRYDDQLKGLFADSELQKEIVDHIYDTENKKKISKHTNITVTNTYDSNNGTYMYIINMTMTYTYSDNGQDVSESGFSQVQKQFNGEELQSIYMICPVFDKFTEAGYATDTIDITYEYKGDVAKEQDVYFYIAEQETKNIEKGYAQRIKPDCLTIKQIDQYGQDKKLYPEYYDELKKDMAKVKVNQTMRFKVLTNIGDADTDQNLSGELHDLTKGDYNTGTALYELLVEVRYRDETIATFTTAR